VSSLNPPVTDNLKVLIEGLTTLQMASKPTSVILFKVPPNASDKYSIECYSRDKASVSEATPLLVKAEL